MTEPVFHPDVLENWFLRPWRKERMKVEGTAGETVIRR